MRNYSPHSTTTKTTTTPHTRLGICGKYLICVSGNFGSLWLLSLKMEDVLSNTREQIPGPGMPEHGVYIESHTHGPRFQTDPHSHPYHSLLFVVSGQGSCVIDGRSYGLTSNTAVVLKSNQPHHMIDANGKAMTVFVVYFSQKSTKIDNGLLGPLLILGRPISTPPHNAQRIRRELRRMLHEQNNRPPWFAEAMRQSLASLMLDLYRIAVNPETCPDSGYQRGSEQRTAEVLKHVSENYYEPQSLVASARMARLSQRQFTTICRRLTGDSFVQYVNRLRTRRAADLLVRTELPVAAIAFEVGFEELSTFYRAFKRFYRKSPLRVRESGEAGGQRLEVRG